MTLFYSSSRLLCFTGILVLGVGDALVKPCISYGSLKLTPLFPGFHSWEENWSPKVVSELAENSGG